MHITTLEEFRDCALTDVYITLGSTELKRGKADAAAEALIDLVVVSVLLDAGPKET